MMIIPASVQVIIDDKTKEVSFEPIWEVEKTNETMVILSNSLMESIITFDIARFPFDELLRLDLYRYKKTIGVKDMYNILSMHIIDTILAAGWGNKSGISRHIYNLWCTVFKELIHHGITSIDRIEQVKSKFKLEFIYTYFCNLCFSSASYSYTDILDTMLINKLNWILYHTEEFDIGFRKLLYNVTITISKQRHFVYSNNPVKLVYCPKEFKNMLPACMEPMYAYDTIIFGHSNDKVTDEWVTNTPMSKYQYCNNSAYESYVGKYTKVQDIINEQEADNKVLICLCNHCEQPAIDSPLDLNLFIMYSHMQDSIVVSEFRVSE